MGLSPTKKTPPYHGAYPKPSLSLIIKKSVKLTIL